MIKHEILEFMNLRISEVPFHRKGIVASRFADNPLTKCDNSPLEHTMLIELNCSMDENIDILVQPLIALEELQARADFMLRDRWSGQETVIECDSREWHSSNPEKVEQDKIRDTLLVAGGRQVLRFIGRDLYHRSRWCLGNVLRAINTSRLKIGFRKTVTHAGRQLTPDELSVHLVRSFFTFFRMEIPHFGNITAQAGGSSRLAFFMEKLRTGMGQAIENIETVITGETPGWGATANTGTGQMIFLHPALEKQDPGLTTGVLAILLAYSSLSSDKQLQSNKAMTDRLLVLLTSMSGKTPVRICPFCRSDLKEPGVCPICREASTASYENIWHPEPPLFTL